MNKVTELINNQVSNSLKEVKASKTQKPKETKESKAKEEPKAKLVKLLPRKLLLKGRSCQGSCQTTETQYHRTSNLQSGSEIHLPR